MKRIAKIENFEGVILKTKDNKDFKFLEEKIIKKELKEINEKIFNVITFNDCYELVYRNTEACTFYELNEIELSEEDEILSNITEENAIPVDLYSKKIVKTFLIDNENYEIFGFIDDMDVAYIPFKPDRQIEHCYVCIYDEIKEFVTEEKDIEGKLLFLVDGIDYRLKTEYDESNKTMKVSYFNDENVITRIEFNKMNSEKIVSLNNKLGFVKQNKVYSINVYNIGFFQFKTLLIEDFNDDMTVIYKRYISNKKTRGITDVRFEEDIFGFFK